MFSIIIPLYNKEKSCAKSIRSILNQTYGDWELIIINDGSTDQSLKAAQKAAQGDKRVRFIEQKNRGVSAARNSGIKSAKNEYVAFLDADDYWHHQYLEIIKYIIDNFSDYQWWASDYLKGDDDYLKKYYTLHECYLFNSKQVKVMNYLKESIRRLCINMDCVVIKRSFLMQSGGFRENLVSNEDQDLFARLALKSKLPRISYKLTYYRTNAENRCCIRINKEQLDLPLMPFVQENIADLSSAKCRKYNDTYWTREYVYDRFLLHIWMRYRNGYLSWFSFIKEILRCRNTRESRLFFLSAILFSLIPRCLHSTLGRAWPRNLQHFMSVRTDN